MDYSTNVSDEQPQLNFSTIISLGLISCWLGAFQTSTAADSNLLLSDRADNVATMIFSPDGRQLLVARNDSTITLWDTTTGQSLAKLSADGTKHLAFSADGWMFAAVGQDGRYRVWEAATADELVAYTPQHPDGFSYRFTPDFDQLVIGTKLGKLEFVEVATGKNHRSINAVGLGAITATAFSSQKTFLTATGFPSNGIRFWDLSTGEPSQKLKNLARIRRPREAFIRNFDSRRMIDI